ncbi:UNVERIFIED_CONTAM: hypothetical protein Slati_2878900 [Sesamum latifolium]|uniref:Uncharacterized protein n=1 Tax=Sesamum latifolium TaxID=2727402 RepID=A0AAW2VC88_9LAMI
MQNSRSCACETCDFSGTYTDLRKHARLVHPLVRPTDADPERQRSWRRLERQRDLGDLLSTLQSSIGEDRTEESTLTIDEGGWLTVFFLVRFIRPGNTSSRSSTARAVLKWPYGEDHREGFGVKAMTRNLSLEMRTMDLLTVGKVFLGTM